MPLALASLLLNLPTPAHGLEVVSAEAGLVRLAVEGDPDAVEVEGGEVLSRTHRAAPPIQRRTRILLVAEAAEASLIRELARGFSTHLPGTASVELVGSGVEVRGGEALATALADAFADPLVEHDVGAFLTAPGGPEERRILIASPDLPAPLAPPLDGTIVHVVVLRRPGLTAPPPTGDLRRALARTGGELIVTDSLEEAQARLTGLRDREPSTSHLELEICAHASELAVRAPGRAALVLPPGTPTCAAISPESDRGGSPPWIPIAGGLGLGLTAVMGVIALIGGLRWRSRATPTAPPHDAPSEEAPAPGRLVVTPDPDATAWLTIRRGAGLVGEVIPLPVGRLGIGAARGNEALIDLAGISGKHARFERFPTGDIFVFDADSANGTWVGGRRLERGERARLRVGERVALGPSLELELGLREDEA